MAKDDYFVLVYQILKYLYECLKQGKPVETKRMSIEALDIPETYWYYIFENLMNQGFVTGIKIVPRLGGDSISIEKIQITPDGIAYLFDNNFSSKAKKAIKDIKDMVPGL